MQKRRKQKQGKDGRPHNLGELAAHLGLSVASVSFVLNGRAREMRISKSTEQRVLEAAESFGIQPNRIAASLRSGRTGSVGLVVPDISNPFFAALAQQLERQLRQNGQAVLLCDSSESEDAEEASLQDLRQRRVDGMIIAPVGAATPSLEAIAESRFPAVCLDRVIPGLEIPRVSIDHAAAAQMAVNVLLENGHRRIGCLRGLSGIFADEERVRGYREALRSAGVEPQDKWVGGGDYTRETAIKEAIRLLRVGELTAIVPLGSQITLGLLEAVRELDLRCPEDVSIVAFDEQPWCSLIFPPLSTIRQPVEEIAEAVVRQLLARIAGKQVKMDIMLPPSLIQRRSVAAPSPDPSLHNKK